MNHARRNNLRFTLIAIGKIKSPWMQEGIAEYADRIKHFAQLQIISIPSEEIRPAPSAKEIEIALAKEGKKIMSRQPADAWSIALNPEAEPTGSIGLARIIEKQSMAGTAHFAFVIGGSHGLSKNLTMSCRQRISFGKNIFPHQLFRIIFLEQLYRANTIMAGTRYHK